MKKGVGQLKQPNKFTHQFLMKKQQNDGNDLSDNDERQQDKLKETIGKHKIIEKQKYVRKIINKPNQPSALRLEQINKTFNKLSEKSNSFIVNLNIDHQLLTELVNLKDKFKCKCKKNIKYYCLKCNQHCSLLKLPSMELPLNIHIIHHMAQKINKSSVAPMRFLSDSVKFYPFANKQANQKEGWNQQEVFDKLPKIGTETYILYPHKNSKSLKQIQTKISNLIVLDCTWFQTDQIIQNLEQLGYKNFLKLQGYQSVFWRYNHYGQEALSSAQSIMYFLREYQTLQGLIPQQFDNLMLLYALNMQMVGKSIQE